MKKALLFRVSLFFLLSCTSDSLYPFNNSLIGKWQWVSTSGGFAGGYYTPDSEGYSRIIEFKNEENYCEYIDDTLNSNRLYIKKKILIYGSDSVNVISFDYHELIEEILKLKNDTLVLSENCTDFYTKTFVKII